jgi:probable HAF family extracellular repeat protein
MTHSKFRNDFASLRHIALVGCALLGASLSRPALAQSYSVTDLGTLGGSSTYAEHINEAGVVVGDSNVASGAVDAFYWNNGTMTGLGLTNSVLTPIAFGINNAAQFQIVGTDVGFFGASGTAFLWQNNNLTWLPSFGGSTYAYRINDAGQIVGAADVNGNRHATLWYNGSISDLGILPGGTQSFAQDINAYGYIVGSADDASANNHAVYWDSTGIHDLGTLPNGTSSSCYGVQRAESYSFAVGESNTLVNGTEEEHACAFDGDSVEDLGTLGGNLSAAYAVNDYFQIVGSTERTDGSFAAFLYSWYGANMYDLNALISPSTGWQLTSATSVNDHGQITGYGQLNGQTHAFLLTPTYHIKSVTVSPGTVPGSISATGVVTLDAPAPTDLVIYLGSTGQVAIPSYCILPEGETSQEFFIDTTAVASPVTVQIVAYLYGDAKSAPLTVRPIGVKALAVSPASVKGGAGKVVTGKITLEGPASPMPITVTLASSNNSAASPAVSSVVVPEGKTTVNFNIVTGKVSASTVVTFKATANGIAKTAKLTVTP